MNSCGCNDWKSTHRRAMLARQGQRVPIPRAVLDGETAGISRRDFLRNGAVAFMTVYGASTLSWGRIWDTAAAQAATPVTDPIIVSIFLDGGNDGLNTLVPVTGADYAAYVTKRTHIKLDPDNCLPLAGPAPSTDFRWHPNATGFRQLYDAGKMAVIPAVDYQPPDLSHFHSRAFWQAGKLDPSPSTGWLGRWVDQNGGAANPLQAISVDWTLDGSLKSAANPVAVLSSTEDAQFGMRNVWTDQSAMVGTLESLTQRPAVNPAMAAADDALGGAVSIANRLSGLGATPDLAAPYGNSDFERRMSMLAWLISANVGIRVACLSFDDGFDFHDAQLSRQGGIMTRLSRGLAAFQSDLEARGVADRVITLVWSEFGRRVEDNDSGGGGTDHGAGGLALAIGSGVRPGIASEFPGIADGDLDEWGNLRVPTDYRQIYTSLLGDWMGTDPADVIPDAAAFPALPLVA
jgi:uncharacterized protein (DUF1501 family)